MTIEHMTLAEAKAAGLLNGKVRAVKRSTKKAAPREGARSTCQTHGLQFTTTAAENRHVLSEHGCRIVGDIS